MLLSSSSPARSSILDAIRRARRISKLSVGHDESGKPIDVDHVSIHTIDSILRQKTRRITDIELEASTTAPLPSLLLIDLDDATSTSPSKEEQSQHRIKVAKNSPTSYDQVNNDSSDSENTSTPMLIISSREPDFIMVITDVEPVRPKSSMKILTQEESLSSPYLSNMGRISSSINNNHEDMLERDALYAELRELILSNPRRPIRRGRRRFSRRAQASGEDTSEVVAIDPPPEEERSRQIKKQSQSLHMLHPDAIFHRLLSEPRTTKKASPSSTKKTVHFGIVQVRTYNTILGDHPVATGPSLSLGWICDDDIFVNLQEYESTKEGKLQDNWITSPIALTTKERANVLTNAGYTLDQLQEAELSKTIIQSQREETIANLRHGDHNNIRSYIDGADNTATKGGNILSKVSKAA